MAGCRESLTFTCNADYEQIFSHSNPQLPSVFFLLCAVSLSSRYFLPFICLRPFRTSLYCSYPPCSSSFSPELCTSFLLSIFSVFYYFLSSLARFLVPHSLFSSSNSSPFLLSPPVSIHSYRFLLQPFFFKFCTTLPLFFPFLCYLSSLSSYIVFICSFSSTQQAVRCIWKAVSFYSEESGSHLNRWFMTEDFIKSWNQISACHVAP